MKAKFLGPREIIPYPIVRFDKIVQTSQRKLTDEMVLHKQNTVQSMRSFQTFMDNVLVNIKRSNFAVAVNDQDSR